MKSEYEKCEDVLAAAADVDPRYSTITVNLATSFSFADRLRILFSRKLAQTITIVVDTPETLAVRTNTWCWVEMPWRPWKRKRRGEGYPVLPGS